MRAICGVLMLFFAVSTKLVAHLVGEAFLSISPHRCCPHRPINLLSTHGSGTEMQSITVANSASSTWSNPKYTLEYDGAVTECIAYDAEDWELEVRCHGARMCRRAVNSP